jgi:hypothetical protein
MEDFQQRVADEKKELDEKLTRLDAFIQKEKMYQQLDHAEQGRLARQAVIMHGYSAVLAERIAAFKQVA